ncbi:hypothetical protein SEI61121_01910 [Salmonella enterica subsp. indica serovar 6,14,25:z10:1,(2),7 str. 1121]|uniref:Uncharacterized protein n=1 Tax=Salmonella enterica subsp. indica serovar 6,14,25:z10:1,(2),7 str. 1121 TaxID=1173950 RepID=V1H981_SALER|nr:hypothetical protein SEI61121_01910 [Salmonella enterica subsp. indica serovar 6,14,25:z10:1,(2),7 str. 1121]
MISDDATIGLFGSKMPEAKTLPLKHRQHNTGKTFLVNNILISSFDIIDKLNVY